MRTTPDGRGVIGILAANQLIMKPRLYSSFLLWLLSELFEQLPEVGDLDKPKLVFVFDEAHLLFDDAPDALRQRVEQVVRLIRSKGVGVYFCSQFPDDVRSEEHTSELQSLMRISYAVFCLKKKKTYNEYVSSAYHETAEYNEQI